VPRVTPNLIVVDVHTCKDVPTSQSITDTCEDVLEITQEMDAQKESSTARNLSTGYGSGNKASGIIDSWPYAVLPFSCAYPFR
jgi:hypothetical protein